MRRKILIFIFVIILLFYLYIIFFPPKIESYSFKEVDYENFLQEADNGDLIFLCGQTYGERVCRSMCRCPFSHVGILFREKNQEGESILYIWECDLGQGYNNGPRVVLAKDKLKKYKGNIIAGWKKFQKDRPSTSNILECVNKYIKYDFDNVMGSWFFSGVPLIYKLFKYQDKVFCSELVAMTYQDLGILPKKDKAFSYSPGTFFRDENNFSSLFQFKYK